MTLVVRGIPQAVAELDPVRIAGRLEPAFAELGREVASEAKTLMAGHRLTGEAAASLEASASGGSLGSLRSEIQSHDPAVAALSFGWHGHGTQPPTAPIATWLERRGQDPAAAFAVARSIGQRGLSFAPLHLLERAWTVVEPRVNAIVERALGGRV